MKALLLHTKRRTHADKSVKKTIINIIHLFFFGGKPFLLSAPIMRSIGVTIHSVFNPLIHH